MFDNALNVISYALQSFYNECVYPLFGVFDLGKVLLLLFAIVLSVRFLLMPIFAGRPFSMGSDKVSKKGNSSSTELKVQR